jgi:uncharacterized protein YlxP (DUF503 family)
VLAVDLHLPYTRSLKEKRALVKPILVGARQRFAVAAAEVDHQELRQRAGLAMAAVAASVGQVAAVLDEVERYVWSDPRVEVIAAERSWLEPEG